MLVHQGIDWLAAGLTIWAIYLLGERQRYGFIIMITGNLAWVLLGVMVDSLAMIVSNLLFMLMNLRGYVAWARGDTGKDSGTA